MARFVFVTWGGGGNATATFPIVGELVDRGHQVQVVGSPTQQADVEPLGATFLPYRHVPPNDGRYAETDAIRDWEGRTPISGLRRGLRWMSESVPAAAREVLDVLGGDGDAVVVADEMMPGILLGAEAAGVRSAALIHSVWHHPVPGALPMGLGLQPSSGALGRARDRTGNLAFAGLVELTRPALNRHRRDLGLAPVRRALDQLLGADRLLVLTSRAFDFVPSGLPAHAAYVGAPAPAPAGTWAPPPGEEPLVLVSLSTTVQGQSELVARLASALARLPVRAIVTTGPIDPDTIPAADNVTVVRHAPHSDVLPHAAVVVTHAGHGTAIAAMRHGVPALCIPHGRDQPDVAARVLAAGAGLKLSRGASAEAFTAAVRRLLDEPGFAQAARSLADRIADEGGGTGRAADELEALAYG